MKIVTLRRNDGAHGIGALLSNGTEVLDFSAASSPSVEATNGVYDVSGASFAALAACVARTANDPAYLASLRAAGHVRSRTSVRLGAPIPRPGKIICIGLNYRDHAEESGMKVPDEPVTFSKYPTCAIGPLDTVVIPKGSVETDYEAEFAFVIGRKAKDVSVADAMDHVLGYLNFNDVSARDFQFKDGQWIRGKACDTFAPMGEYLVTKDEIRDPHALRIQLRLNGQTMQDSSTNQLIFRIPELIEFLSRFITLEPGDVIATGTPPGVGFARKPPVYLKDGDVMEVEIEGLGILKNPVRSA